MLKNRDENFFENFWKFSKYGSEISENIMR